MAAFEGPDCKPQASRSSRVERSGKSENDLEKASNRCQRGGRMCARGRDGVQDFCTGNGPVSAQLAFFCGMAVAPSGFLPRRMVTPFFERKGRRASAVQLATNPGEKRSSVERSLVICNPV